MKLRVLGLLMATLLLFSGVASAQNDSKLNQWNGEVVGNDQNTGIVSLYSREKQQTYKVWVHLKSQVTRDGQERAINASDLLMGDVIKVDGFQLDDGRIVGIELHYPEKVAQAPANRTTLLPQAGSRLASNRPTIGANFAGQIDPATVRVFLDGREVTTQTAVDGKSVAYNPPADLAAGSHQVRLLAKDDWGDVNQVWSFNTLAAAQPKPQPAAPLTLNLTSPTGNSQVPKNFVVSGTTKPGASVNLNLTPNQKVLGGFLGVQGSTKTSSTQADASGKFQFNVNSPYKSGTSFDIGVTSSHGNETTPTKHFSVTQQ